eukprot:TRINITY_DN65583_c0_g1_i1.p1 TRINITY_DN65583_c0_g1~~TRINITY_DN65583_c0_g1_i1.p1  ORF type:complete len:502 (-),score=134.82 TRINITY_DN65583_c0_g1_i1:15-1520(-)
MAILGRRDSRRGLVVAAVCFACVQHGAAVHTSSSGQVAGRSELNLEAWNSLFDSVITTSADFRTELVKLVDTRQHHALLKRRLAAAKAWLLPDFEASSKAVEGHLPLEAVRPLLRSFFAKEHGWVLRGLEPPGQGVDEVTKQLHKVHILQDGAPDFASLLRRTDSGHRPLSLGDAASLAVALEWLILRRSLQLLDAAYLLNSLSPEEPLLEADVERVLQSYLLLFRQGSKADLVNQEKHQAMKRRAVNFAGWLDLVEFVSDKVNDFKGAADDAAEKHFGVADVQDIVLTLALGYGKWQDKECQQMKKDLRELDREGLGSVLFRDFQAFPGDPHFGYKFLESTDYLRHIGALDEVDKKEPQVFVANYLHGPSNCIASSAYVAVCCINDCERKLSLLESKAHQPWMAPRRLMRLELSSPTPADAEQEQQLAKLSDAAVLASEVELTDLAKANGGTVPLQGQGFKKWMHHRYPYECPVPWPLSTNTEADRLADEPISRVPLYMV